MSGFGSEAAVAYEPLKCPEMARIGKAGFATKSVDRPIIE